MTPKLFLRLREPEEPALVEHMLTSDRAATPGVVSGVRDDGPLLAPRQAAMPGPAPAAPTGPATAQQLHLGEPELVRIIGETDRALADMRKLNHSVQASADVIMRNSQSDSGRIMQAKLGIWTADYAAIEASLLTLNNKVQQVRQLLIATERAARDAAGTA